MSKSKTITAYLVDGDPDLTSYYNIANRVCRMYLIPRSNISYASKHELLQQHALYILINDEEKIAYIGETDNFKNRIKQHDATKSFWNKAYVFIATDGSLTKADVQYLEYLAIRSAVESNNYDLSDNKRVPNEPNIPEMLISKNEEFFEDVRLLVSFDRCDIFKNQISCILRDDDDDNNINIDPKLCGQTFYFKNKSGSVDATMSITSEGYKVLAGSIISENTSGTTITEAWKLKRDTDIKNWCSKQDNDIILNRDMLFKSPSGAACFVSGRAANGWKVWLTEDDVLLDEYRDK